MKKQLLCAAIMLLSAVMVPAYAATSSTTLDVSAIVGLTCTISTSAVDFGNVDPIIGASTSGIVSVNCPAATLYNIAMDAGQNYTGTSREVSNGLSTMAYRLYDPMTGIQWGDGDYAGTYPWGSSVSGTGTGITDDYLIDAILDGGVPVPDGIYSDIVNVTIYY